jgi:hypothetical protein
VRTTVTLDADSAAIVRDLQRRRGLSFKEALNEAIRAGARRDVPAVEPPTADMGRASVDLDHALRLLAEMDDAEIVRKSSLRK